jgi:hypothetical protein
MLNYKSYNHHIKTYFPNFKNTYHSRFIPEGVAETSQALLLDTHILLK